MSDNKISHSLDTFSSVCLLQKDFDLITTLPLPLRAVELEKLKSGGKFTAQLIELMARIQETNKETRGPSREN